MSDNEALERNRENRTMRRLTSTRFKLNDNQDNNQDNKQDNEQDNKEVKKYALVDEMNHQVVNEIVPDDNNQSDKISDIANREDSDRPIRTLRKKGSTLPKRRASERIFDGRGTPFRLSEKTERSMQHTSINIEQLEQESHEGDDSKKIRKLAALEPVRVIDRDKEILKSIGSDEKRYSVPPSRRTTLKQKDIDLALFENARQNPFFDQTNMQQVLTQNNTQPSNMLLHGLANSKLGFSGGLTRRTSMEKAPQNNDDLDNEIEGKLQNLIDEWFIFCERNSVLHSMCCAFYKRWGNIVSLSAIFLSTVAGTSSLATSGEEGEKRRAISIVLGILGLLSGSLMTVHRYFNFNQLEKDHSFYSSEYAKLKNEMHMQLYIHQCNSKTYVNLVEFCKSIKGNIDSLLDRSPAISNTIVQQYEERKKKNKNESKYIPSLMIFNRAN